MHGSQRQRKLLFVVVAIARRMNSFIVHSRSFPCHLSQIWFLLVSLSFGFDSFSDKNDLPLTLDVMCVATNLSAHFLLWIAHTEKCGVYLKCISSKTFLPRFAMCVAERCQCGRRSSLSLISTSGWILLAFLALWVCFVVECQFLFFRKKNIKIIII